MPYPKEVTLIGDLFGGTPSGGGAWVHTLEGLRYRLGSRDSMGSVAKRYMGSPSYAQSILDLQPANVRRALRPGALIRMPKRAERVAMALGLVPQVPTLPAENLSGLADISDAWTQGHEIQEHIHAIILTVDATVQRDQATIKKIDGPTLQAWAAFVNEWARFRAAEPSLFSNLWLPAGVGGALYLKTLSDRYDAMRTDWGPKADAWAKNIGQLTGGLVAPVSPSFPTPPAGGGGGGGGDAPPSLGGDTPWSAARWVAVAAIVGAIAYTVSPAVRTVLTRVVK